MVYECLHIGFGKFHYYLLFICGSFFGIVAISITSVSFVVPSAQCDFKMTSVHKGLLNGIAMIGTSWIYDRRIWHTKVIYFMCGEFQECSLEV